jgi:hypothetical protein
LALGEKKISCYPAATSEFWSLKRHDTAATTAMNFFCQHAPLRAGLIVIVSLNLACPSHEKA